jgi:hypothetical protein
MTFFNAAKKYHFRVKLYDLLPGHLNIGAIGPETHKFGPGFPEGVILK